MKLHLAAAAVIGYLTCGKGFDAPQELRNVLDGHLEAEGVCSERQHLWLLQELTASGLLCSHHSLRTRTRTAERDKGDKEQFKEINVLPERKLSEMKRRKES